MSNGERARQHPWMTSALSAVVAAAITTIAGGYVTTMVLDAKVKDIGTKIEKLEDGVEGLTKKADAHALTLVAVRTTLEEGMRPQMAQHDRRIATLEAQMVATQQRLAETLGVLSQVQSSLEAVLRAMGQQPPGRVPR